MIFLMLLACTVKSVYHGPTSRINSISTGGGSGEFYIASDVMCGSRFLTSRVTLCKFEERTKETTCVNVADTDSLDKNIGLNGSKKFKAEVSDIICKSSFYELDIGESGWTPTDDYTTGD